MVSVERAGTGVLEEVGPGFGSHLAVMAWRGSWPTPPMGGK